MIDRSVFNLKTNYGSKSNNLKNITYIIANLKSVNNCFSLFIAIVLPHVLFILRCFLSCKLIQFSIIQNEREIVQILRNGHLEIVSDGSFCKVLQFGTDKE